MAYEDILYEVDGGVAVIKLNRPDRLNAWRGEMERELRSAMRNAGADPDVTMRAMPIAPEDLRSEGLSDGFIEYMKVFKGFVAEA